MLTVLKISSRIINNRNTMSNAYRSSVFSWWSPQVLVQQQKSRAFYRIQATRMMIGAGNILKKHAADQARKVVSSGETREQEDDPYTTRLEFEPVLYQCFENCGSLKLTVGRHGGDAGCTVKVATA